LGERDVSTASSNSRHLQDIRLPIRAQLTALWASVMFCYIYADYFGLFVPGALQAMLNGRMGPLGPTTQSVLLSTSAVLAIPALMISLSALLPPVPNRWVNIIVGTLYTAIILATMWGWAFFIFYGVIEVALTSFVVWRAFTWPKIAAVA
jgi:hypothetical protein